MYLLKRLFNPYNNSGRQLLFISPVNMTLNGIKSLRYDDDLRPWKNFTRNISDNRKNPPPLILKVGVVGGGAAEFWKF